MTAGPSTITEGIPEWFAKRISDIVHDEENNYQAKLKNYCKFKNIKTKWD